jgi:hypothetical protein
MIPVSDPEFTEFSIPGEMSSMYFSPYNTVANDIYGSTFVWSNEKRGECVTVRSADFSTGSGANGISLSPKEDVIAISMSNPQSGWVGGVCTIYCNNPELFKKSSKSSKCVTQ